MNPSARHPRLLIAAIVCPLVMWNIVVVLRRAFGDFPTYSAREYGTGVIVSVVAGMLIVWPMALVFRRFGWTKLRHALLLGLVSGWVYVFASEIYVRLLAEGFHRTDTVHSILGVFLLLLESCVYLLAGALFFLIAYYQRTRQSATPDRYF